MCDNSQSAVTPGALDCPPSELRAMALPYQQPGLALARGVKDPARVRSLQRDLRRLGYLAAGIDGVFLDGTERAIQALQYDLLNNHGRSSHDDGSAPVAVADYNRGRVAVETGVLDQGLAACIADLLADAAFPKLPGAEDAAAANERALTAIDKAGSAVAPTPMLRAIVTQETGGRHFVVPGGGDEDNFVLVGLDRGGGGHVVTSRGYGIGQATLFHHPPRPQEVEELILDPVRNVAHAYKELRRKFDGYVVGPEDTADDHAAEHAGEALRMCLYPPGDPLYLRDCANCARKARKVDIKRGQPVHAGAGTTYEPTQYYASANYRGVPDRADFPCDWPYAVRRYNGGGINSYHYQARVLLNLLAAVPVPTP